MAKYKSSQISSNSVMPKAYDQTASLRREDNYQRQDEARINAALERNNKYLSADATRLQNEILQKQKDLEKWGETILDDAGGVWDQIAQFSPTLQKLAQSKAKAVEEESGSFAEMNAALDYLRNGPSEKAQQEADVLANDQTDVATAGAAGVLAEQGATAGAAKVIGHVSNRSWLMAKQVYLDEATNNYGGIIEDYLRSDEEVDIYTDDGVLIGKQPINEAWNSASGVMQQRLMADAHRKAVLMLGIDKHTPEDLQNSKWFSHTRNYQANVLKLKADENYLKESNRKIEEETGFLAHSINNGDPNAIEKFRGILEGSASPRGGGKRRSGDEVLDGVHNAFEGLYGTDKIDRAGLTLILNSPGWRGDENKTIIKDQVSLALRLMRTADKIDSDREKAKQANEELEKEKAQQSILKGARNEDGKFDARLVEDAGYRDYKKRWGTDPLIEQWLSEHTVQAEYIQDRTDQALEEMRRGVYDQEDYNKELLTVQENIEEQWTSYKERGGNYMEKMNVEETINNMVDKGTNFNPAGLANKKHGYAQKRAFGAISGYFGQLIARNRSAGMEYEDAVDAAMVTLQKEFVEVNEGSTIDKTHLLHYSSGSNTFPNMDKWYGTTTTLHKAKEASKLRLNRLNESPVAYTTDTFWAGSREDSAAYLTKIADRYEQSPYQYPWPAEFDTIAKMHPHKSRVQILNESLAGSGVTRTVKDFKKEHKLFHALSEEQIQDAADDAECYRSARNIGAACNATGEPLYKSAPYLPVLEKSFPDPEMQLHAAGLIDAIRFNSPTVKNGRTPTVEETYTQFNAMIEMDLGKGNTALNNYLESKGMKNTAIGAAVIAMMSGGPAALQAGPAVWDQAINNYGRFSYRQTGDNRFLEMVQLQNPRQLSLENNIQMQYAPDAVDFDVADRTLSAKEQALLNTIRFAEGTYDEVGYRKHFGGSLFDDFTKHPDKVKAAGGYRSAAAGGYQFMPATWAAAQRATGVPDFSPVSQDAAALYLIKQRGVDPNKMNELTPEIANALAPEWASFPTLKGVSYYGQPNKKVSALQQFYNRQLKRLSK